MGNDRHYAALFSLLQPPIASAELTTNWNSYVISRDVATQESEESAMAFKVSKTSHNSRTKHYFANP